MPRSAAATRNKLDREQGANVTDLHGRFDTKPYLTPHSDIVALMVLEHQTAMHNQITIAGYQAMLAREEQEVLNKLDGKPADSPIESIERRYQWAADDVLKCLLLSGEARLTDAVRGTSGFAEHFAGLGPRDHRGRSLREFDLHTRLFKYPCSYLIYTAAFQQLPLPVKQRVYQRLWRILTSQETAGEFPSRSQRLPGNLRDPERHIAGIARVLANQDSVTSELQSLQPNHIVTKSGEGACWSQRGIRTTFWLSVVPPIAGFTSVALRP